MDNLKETKKPTLVKTLLVIVALAAFILGAIVVVPSVALAQEDEPTEPTTPAPEAPGMRGFRIFGHFHAFGHRGGFMFGGDIDYDTLLADALGITVDELQAARQEANEAALAQAVERGYLTEEQAELLKAQYALIRYIDRDALVAQALGISVEDLQAARDEGKSLATLIDELGLEAADVRDNLQAAYEAAVQQAVDEGVITQEQADQILSGERGVFKFRGMRDFGGRGTFRGFGIPCDPDTINPEGSGL